MAIQLSERDHLIFKLLAEHSVLLEKHIAWFITQEDKPVLIRDRLRKLFYLDYLICQRYDDKLSWWTTPTKPLVYMLTPLARAMSGVKNGENRESSSNQRQKCLEIANIRMIFLIAQTKGFLQNFQWTTCLSDQNDVPLFDAFISCSNQSVNHNLGVLSHPKLSDELICKIEHELVNKHITNVIIVSRDQAHQKNLQKLLANSRISAEVDKVIFAVHQDLYKSDIDNVQWFNVAGQYMNFLSQVSTRTASLSAQNQAFSDINAA